MSCLIQASNFQLLGTCVRVSFEALPCGVRYQIFRRGQSIELTAQKVLNYSKIRLLQIQGALQAAALVLNFLLQQCNCVNQLLGARRAPRNIHVNRDHLINPL